MLQQYTAAIEDLNLVIETAKTAVEKVQYDLILLNSSPGFIFYQAEGYGARASVHHAMKRWQLALDDLAKARELDSNVMHSSLLMNLTLL